MRQHRYVTASCHNYIFIKITTPYTKRLYQNQFEILQNFENKTNLLIDPACHYELFGKMFFFFI